MTNPNIRENLEKARELINAEIDKQLKMWGDSNERADATNKQLFYAGFAQLDALYDKSLFGHWPYDVPGMYPVDWSGFRDYGSDIANMVVGIAFLTNEMARLIGNGESTYRRPRDENDPKFADKPNPVDGVQSIGTP